ILDRFEQGLSEIEESALALMRSAAEDTWHGTEQELKELRERTFRDLSRDHALRGLIAHADERYQAIDVRVARMERNLANVEHAAGALTAAIGEAADDPSSAVLISGRIAAMEGSLEGVRTSTRLLQERLDGGLADITALVSELRLGAAAEAEPTGGPE